MSIEIGLTIKELALKARQFGVYEDIVPTGKNDKIMKDDMIAPIRKHSLISRYGSEDNVPEDMKLILELKSPMLAARIDGLKEEQQTEIWGDDNWGFEEKLNGVRNYIVNVGNGIHLYSRHSSDVDLLPIEFTEKVLFPDQCDLSRISKSFIIDNEITSDVANISTVVGKYGVVTETMLQAVTSLISSDASKAKVIQQSENLRLTFNSFDCIYYDGKWLLNEPLHVRKQIAEEIVVSLENCGFKIRRVKQCPKGMDKQKFFQDIVAHGGEGCLAKRLDGLYNADNTRGFKQGWIKVKRSTKASLALDENSFGDTIDAWISGYKPGNKGTAFENYIGVVCVSINLLKPDGTTEVLEIGQFSGIPMSLREDMTELINGEPTLKPEYFGRVCEIDGMSVSSRERRLNHCQFLGFRYDKGKDSCFMEESFLNSMIQ